jgi:transcriptional regulator with GAF, ATPase, and Fis domain
VLTESLFEAEVFGYARGAFTGSVGEHTGLFEQADGGTLFLDEIGELPLSQQVKLLRALETGQYRRVGGRRSRKADVRIVCATNRHLWESVTAGQFREDLYYRIACLAVRLPPLRDRLGDIEVLVPNLLEPLSRTMGRRFALSPEAIERLKNYDYPGNIRELRNILFIAATNSPTGKVDGGLVAKVLQQHGERRAQVAESTESSVDPEAKQAPGAQVGSQLAPTLHEVEAQHIAQLLVQYHNNRRKVAEALAISERTLYRKLKRYQLS